MCNCPNPPCSVESHILLREVNAILAQLKPTRPRATVDAGPYSVL